MAWPSAAPTAAPMNIVGVNTPPGLPDDTEAVLTTRVMAPGDDDARAGYLQLPDGHQVAVVPAPDWLVGRAPDLAALRADLGIIVVAVERARDARANAPRWLDPDLGVVLEPGDRLMVIATAEELARLASARS